MQYMKMLDTQVNAKKVHVKTMNIAAKLIHVMMIFRQIRKKNYCGMNTKKPTLTHVDWIG